LHIAHPLGSVGLLDRWLGLDRGPLAMGGDSGSLNAAWYRVDAVEGLFHTTIGPSMRFVLDWSDPDEFTLGTQLGQSGNPLSPHYDDFLDDWYVGRSWTVPGSRTAVEARAASRLHLVP
jgi:acyl-homoserine lactone acylase PvdQ